MDALGRSTARVTKLGRDLEEAPDIVGPASSGTARCYRDRAKSVFGVAPPSRTRTVELPWIHPWTGRLKV